MSMSKRIMFDDDPRHDEIRAEIKRRTWDYIDQFKFRIQGSKLKMRDGKRRKDAFWGYALHRAVRELNTECVSVNGGLFFRTVQERDAVLKLANTIYEAPHPMKRYC